MKFWKSQDSLRAVVCFSLFTVAASFVTVTAPIPFANHRVLQWEQPVPVWGKANAAGEWRVSLDAMPDGWA